MDANKVTQQLNTGHRGRKVSKKERVRATGKIPRNTGKVGFDQVDAEKDTGNTGVKVTKSKGSASINSCRNSTGTNGCQ